MCNVVSRYARTASQCGSACSSVGYPCCQPIVAFVGSSPTTAGELQTAVLEAAHQRGKMVPSTNKRHGLGPAHNNHDTNSLCLCLYHSSTHLSSLPGHPKQTSVTEWVSSDETKGEPTKEVDVVRRKHAHDGRRDSDAEKTDSQKGAMSWGRSGLCGSCQKCRQNAQAAINTATMAPRAP